MIDNIRRARVQEKRISIVSLDGSAVSEGTMLAEPDAEYTVANRERIAQLLRLLEGPDREVVVLMGEGLSQKAIAERIDVTPPFPLSFKDFL